VDECTITTPAQARTWILDDLDLSKNPGVFPLLSGYVLTVINDT